MSDGTWRFLFMFLVICGQVAFLSILWPALVVPILVLAALVATVVVRGFVTGVWTWFPLLVGYATVSAGREGLLVPFGIVLAYATSFISRRLLSEKRLQSVVLLTTVMLLGVGMALFGLSLLGRFTFSLATIFSHILGTLLFFPPILFMLERLETWLTVRRASEFRGLRQ